MTTIYHRNDNDVVLYLDNDDDDDDKNYINDDDDDDEVSLFSSFSPSSYFILISRSAPFLPFAL